MRGSRRDFMKGAAAGFVALLLPAPAVAKQLPRSVKTLAVVSPPFEYVAGSVRTIAGEIIVSQQLLESMGLEMVKQLFAHESERILSETARYHRYTLIDHPRWRLIPWRDSSHALLQRYQWAVQT